MKHLNVIAMVQSPTDYINQKQNKLETKHMQLPMTSKLVNFIALIKL
jgi:hypothetical protein